MGSTDNFVKFPTDVLEALYARKLSPIHYQIILYVVRKTNGFQKPHDYIAVSKMADDIGRYRQGVSAAVRDLEAMGMLEVDRKWSRKGHEMRVKPVKDWEQTVLKSGHVSNSGHVLKTGRHPSQNQDANRPEIRTYNRYSTIDTLQKINPLNPPYEDEGDIDRSDYTEEEIEQLRKEGWII